MKLIRHLTWQNMRSSKVRTVVTVLGILLSTAMFAAVATMGVSFRAYMMEAEIANNGDYFVRYDYGTMEDLEDLRKEEAVTKLGTIKTLGYTRFQMELPNRSIDDTLIIGAGNREFFEMLPTGLEEGRLPENGSELVITRKVYEYLRESGQPCEIGQTVTLPVDVAYAADNLELPVGETPYEATYTIVGITGYVQYFDDSNLQLSSLLTFDDGSWEGIWGRFYVKTAPRDAYDLAERCYGLSSGVNENLLNFYGVTEYSSVNDLIFSFAAALMAIIMAGSVSLIYNAFSISVSERTKQFGLLSSVGATRRQIRRCVRTEALYLSAVGIPLGLLSGYGGIAVTLHLTHGLIDDLLTEAAENGIVLRAVPSVPAFLTAGIVALVTVLLSAWIPARRATRITPIAAIRQTGEFRVPKHGIRAGKWSQKLFGVPAALARKYYTVNRRKYRATVISLTISMVLFVSAGSFVRQLNAAAEEQISTDNFDFAIWGASQAQIDEIRAHPALRDSALVSGKASYAVIPEEDFTDGYRKAWACAADAQENIRPMSSQQVRIDYLEDDVLRDFLRTQNLDPSPYLDGEDPMALVTSAQITVYHQDDRGRTDNRQRFTEQILKDSVESIDLVPNYLPNGLLDRLGGDVCDLGIQVLDGMVVHSVSVRQPSQEGDTAEETVFRVEVRPMEDGKCFGYYLRDPETGETETEPADIVSLDPSHLRLGASVQTLPVGIRQNTETNCLSVILPLSSASPVMKEQAMLMAATSDYDSFLRFLQEEYPFMDYLESQMQNRDYITMIRIFSYGFITLISLICICNVFNTISTNIALRKKDFGMLRSVGMKNREIHRMMAFECLQYGWKAILWGVPLSLLASVLIARFAAVTKFVVPMGALASAAGCILVTVFITMFYAVSKLRKQNPMEAIRSES